MAAVAALLTSCSKDDTFGGPARGKVTFEVSTPELATRYGDGSKATKLYYAVYDMVENVKVHESTTGLTNGAADVLIDLVEGRKYTAIFWADADLNSPYKFDAVTKTVSYKDLNDLTANNENYDAFFAFVPEAAIKVGQTVDVDLKRPFAQLNIATNDTTKAEALQVVVENTAVTVAGVYTSFNLANGEVQGEPTTVTFASAEKAEGTITTTTGVKDGTYDMLAMNYVLVNPANETLVDVTLNFTDDVNGTEQSYVRQYNKVKVQRNYRTNIVGSILTDETIFDVDIEEGFLTPDNDVNGDNSATQIVSTATEIQAAINGAADGEETTIVANSDIVLGDDTRAGENPYGLLIPAGKIITLDLNGFTISQEKAQTAAYNMIQNQGTLTIMDSSANGGGKISYKDAGNGGEYVSNTIQNSGTLTIEAGTIENNSVENVATNGYPHPIDNSGKLIINGGTFDNNANYSSMRIWCTTDDDTEVTINGGTFYGSIDFQTVNRSANKGTLTINGGEFNADEHCGAAVRLLGFGTDVDEMNGYINGGEFNGVIKLGKYVDGEFNSQVFHISGGTFSDASVFKYLSDSAEEINITMAADMTLDGGTSLNYGGENLKKLTINGGNHNLTYKDSYRTYINLANANATLVLNDMQLFRETSNKDTHWHNNNMKFENNTEMNNVTFNKGITLDDAKTFKLNNVNITKNAVSTYAMFITAGCDVTIDGMIINHADGVKGRGIKIVDEDVANKDAQTKLNISNATFTTAEKAAVLVGSKGGAVINWGEGNDISKVAADKVFAVWVDEDYAAHADKVVVNGAYVKIEGENAHIVASADDLATIKLKMDDKSLGKNAVIYLVNDIDFAGKTWTPVDSHADTNFTFSKLDGKGHTISNLTINGQAMFTRFAGTGDVTIKDVTFDNATVNSTSLNTSILTVQSYQNVLLDNVDVKNSSITGGYKVAPLIATVYNEGSSTVTATLKNCDVEKVTVKATSYDFCTAGMVAFVNAKDNDKIEFENCTVKDVKLIAPDDSYDAHAAIYTTGSDSLFNEAEGVTVSNVTFEAL